MTENKTNLIIFLVLSFAILVVHSFFFAKPAKQVKKETVAQEEVATNFPEMEDSAEPGVFAEAGTISEPDIQDAENQDNQDQIDDFAPKGKLITVETPLYIGVIDTLGSRIVSWELKNYKDSTNGDTKLVNLYDNSLPGFNAYLNLENRKMPALLPYSFEGGSSINVSEGAKELAFTWSSSEDSIQIKKIYEINPESYALKQRFEVKNTTSFPIKERLDIKWSGIVEQKGRGENSKSFIAMVGDEVERVEEEPEETVNYKGVVKWFGYSEKYFMSTFLPETGADTGVHLSPSSKKGQVKAQFNYPPDTIPAGGKAVRNWEVYMGPLEYDLVQPVGDSLEEAINYGWIAFLAKPLLDLLKFINTYVHNYGISIIIITVLIRVVFLPLTIRSMVSMKKVQLKMEKIKPKVDDLKEKYKDDKTKQNSELMKLYSAHGVNPLASLGGCMPMLIQIPVFIALYDVLLHSIDLRHSAFLWIQDLSAPETLFDIPGIGIPFRVLPLLMGVSWFISQKMTPMAAAPGNENMQLQMKMMQFMPIIFTVMFWSLPSGLILYWTVSNILSIGQQIYVNRIVHTPTGG